jgi:hypothetical protein
MNGKSQGLEMALLGSSHGLASPPPVTIAIGTASTDRSPNRLNFATASSPLKHICRRNRVRRQAPET